ncbi:hypothetical protein MN116_002748 [Schistosoma mekongi]|uniref:Uncharacterized protein n=1 Tax=Schistosoma mekongi TaxID=38744 RepID=A0AAE2D7S2_SCHME|nr:hypothetical protein MN116_002748 [Schistosoma mekongi]
MLEVIVYRAFPEGWAKRENMSRKTNVTTTYSRLNRINAVSDIGNDYNNYKRSTQAVDRVISAIQHKRKQIQNTEDNSEKNSTYSFSQPNVLNSQSCHHKAPRSLVQRSRVQQIIEDFLCKARKRGLGGRSKDKNKIPEDIQCHSVNCKLVQSGEGKEIDSKINEYSPPEVNKNLPFRNHNIDCSNVDSGFYHTLSSGLHSPSFSIQSNSPDLFDQRRNEATLETHQKQPINILNRQKKFLFFENPCKNHISQYNYNESIKPTDCYFSWYSDKMRRSPKSIEVPISSINNVKCNFTFDTDNNILTIGNDIIPPNLYRTRTHIISENQVNQFDGEEYRSYDIGSCKNCHTLYSECINTNNKVEDIFDIPLNVYQSTQKPIFINVPSQYNWKSNFNGQFCDFNNLNYYSIEGQQDEFKEFSNESKFRHCMTADCKQLNEHKHDNCCLRKYFEDLKNEQASQNNFYKITSKFTKAHAHTLKEHDSSSRLNSMYRSRVINVEHNKLNETSLCNQDYENKHTVRFFPDERQNDNYIHKKSIDNQYKYTDYLKYDSKSQQEERVKSFGLSHFPDNENIFKPVKTSTVSTQTYSEDDECKVIHCVTYRKLNKFNTEGIYSAEYLDNSEFNQVKCNISPLSNDKYLCNEPNTTTNFTTRQKPLTSSSMENHMSGPLAASTPFSGSTNDNSKCAENKSKVKSKHLMNAYQSFQLPKNNKSDIFPDTTTDNMNEDESVLTLNLLKSTCKSISFENIDYIYNEE